MSKMNLQKSGLMNINKFLVTGHPMSGYEAVAKVLNSGGMPSAKPSRREGMSPSEISGALLKAHQYGSAGRVPVGGEIRQLSVSPVWNGLALDLVLGNIDQPFWCWADAEALPLLEYWTSLDTRLAFVLVYDTPLEMIARALGETETLPADALEAMLDEWSAYNTALLRFYHRNPERAQLVHASRVRADGVGYLQHMRSQTGLPLLAETGDRADAALPLSSPESVLQRYLAEEFLQERPDAMQLYAELQSVADLPTDDAATQSLSVGGLLSFAVQMQGEYRQKLQRAVEEAKALELENGTLAEKLLTAHREQETQAEASGRLLSDLHGVQEQLEELHRQSREQTAGLNQKLAGVTKERDELAQESELLLTQLHGVQEELEKQFVQNTEEAASLNKAMALLRKEKAEQQKAAEEKQGMVEQLSKEKQAHLKELEEKNRLVQEQQGRIASVQSQLESAKKEQGEQSQESELLLTKLHSVQEELEKQFVQNTEEAASLNKAMALLRKEKAEQQKAAEEKQGRVEQLSRESQAHLKELEEKKAQLAALRSQNEQTGKEKEAAFQKLKAADELKDENELLLTQLHTVQEELERYYLENVKLKQKTPVAKPRPYGAAERVKSQLSYRLGARMIENSRSFGGLVSMPVTLVKETRQFRREFAERSKKKLPPISHYTDAHEAERVKKHLSYRLGKAMVEKGRSPIGLVTLPLALRRAAKEYRKERAGA